MTKIPRGKIVRLIRIVATLIVAYLEGCAVAQQMTVADTPHQNGKVSLLFSPYTRHYDYDAEHKNVLMLGLEREHADARVDGISVFKNSFGQPSVYVYPLGGVYHAVGGIKGLSFKWSAGLIYGYLAPYQNKVPLNYKGLSLAIVPALAYEFMPGWSVQVDVLGTAGLMFQLNAALN